MGGKNYRKHKEVQERQQPTWTYVEVRMSELGCLSKYLSGSSVEGEKGICH